MTTSTYFKTVNENGGGYVKQSTPARSKGRITCDLMEAQSDLKSAIVNADYRNGEDGTAHKVERLTALVASLKQELSN
jgi:hypothetical protein